METQQDFIRLCYPKSQMFGPKRASRKSVYQWSAALTLFTENHSSKGLTEGGKEKETLRLNTGMYFQPLLCFCFSACALDLIWFLVFFCQISALVYLPAPPLVFWIPSSPPTGFISSGGGRVEHSRFLESASLTESGCFVPGGMRAFSSCDRDCEEGCVNNPTRAHTHSHAHICPICSSLFITTHLNVLRS